MSRFRKMECLLYRSSNKKPLQDKSLYKGCYGAEIVSLKKNYCAAVSLTLRETNFSLIRADLPERSRR